MYIQVTYTLVSLIRDTSVYVNGKLGTLVYMYIQVTYTLVSLIRDTSVYVNGKLGTLVYMYIPMTLELRLEAHLLVAIFVNSTGVRHG